MNKAEEVLFASLSDVDRLEYVAKESLYLDVIPTEEGRPVVAWAIDRYYESGGLTAPSVPAIREVWAHVLDDFEIPLSDGTEIEDTIEWAVMHLRSMYAHKQFELFGRATASGMSNADPPDRPELLQGYAADLYGLAQKVSRRADDPRPLRVTDQSLPEFPVAVLPPIYRDVVLEVSRATQTSPDVAGTVLLGVLAVCVTGKAEVMVRAKHVEQLSLYTVVAAESGTRKSPVYATLTDPVYLAEKALADRLEPVRREAAGRKDIAEARVKALRAQAAKAERGSPDTRCLEQAAAEAASEAAAIVVPARVEIIADDVTPEAAVSLLARHGRLGICSDEGGLFGSFGRYTRGDPNYEWLLKGYTGSPMKVHRKGALDEPEVIPRANVAMALAVQPTTLRRVCTDPDFVGRGLVARFLFSLPPNNVGWRKTDVDGPDADVVEMYTGSIQELTVMLAQRAGASTMTLSQQQRPPSATSRRPWSFDSAPAAGTWAARQDWSPGDRSWPGRRCASPASSTSRRVRRPVV